MCWGERVRKDFFLSESLAKRDFWGSMKDARIVLGREKIQGFFWVLYLSLGQINSNISAIYCLCGMIWGMLKKKGLFWVDKF